MATSSIADTRNRLNTLVLLLPGQWFAAMAIFWGRFLPPLRPFDFHVTAPPLPWLTVAVAICLLPAFLPAAWFRPRAFERGAFYPRLGLRLFRRLATDGDLVNRRLRRLDPAYRIVRDHRSRAEHVTGTITNERWHLAFALAGTMTCAFAAATDQFGWATAIGILNVIFNVYPVLHQRFTRARLRAAIAPAAISPPWRARP